MRSLSNSQRNLLATDEYVVKTRVKVADESGTMQDLSSQELFDLVDGVSLNNDIDSLVTESNIDIKRQIYNLNASPLVRKSKLNITSTGGYSALLDLNRETQIQTATIPEGTPVSSDDWINVFEGTIEKISPSKDPMSITAHDKGAKIRDRQIEEKRSYGGIGYLNSDESSGSTSILVSYIRDSSVSLLSCGDVCYISDDTNAEEVSIEKSTTGSSDTYILELNSGLQYSYSSAAIIGAKLENILNQLLEDNDLSSITLHAPESPNWAIAYNEQNLDGVLNAMNNYAEQIGWKVNYRYSSSAGKNELQLYEPSRHKIVDIQSQVSSGSTSVDVTYTDAFNTGDELFLLDSSLNETRVVSNLTSDTISFNNSLENTYSENAIVSKIDFTFGPSDYFNVSKVNLDKAFIRNACKVVYSKSSDPETRLSVTETSTASIKKYDRRFMQIAETASYNINSSVEATRLAKSAVEDLGLPKMEQEIELPYFYPVEVGDVYRFRANDVHYDTDQVLSVTNYRHDLRAQNKRTYIYTRGRPAGAYTGWMDKVSYPGMAPIPDEPSNIKNVTLTSGLEGNNPVLAYIEATWKKPSGRITEYEVRYRQPSDTDWKTKKVSNTRCKIENLLPNTTYQVQVRSHTIYGGSGNLTYVSNWNTTSSGGYPDSTTVKDSSAPPAPVIDTINDSLRGYTIFLDESSLSGSTRVIDFSGYVVYDSTSSGFTPSSTNLVTKGDQDRFEITGKDPGKIYYVKTKAYDTSGNYSDSSNEASTAAGSEIISSTLVVAAHNSSDRGKVGADYTCTGDNDQEQINNAINLLYTHPLFLYREGDEKITWVEGHWEGDGDQSKVGAHLYLYASDTSGRAESTYVTGKKINMTKVNTISIDWENTGHDNSDNESWFIIGGKKEDPANPFEEAEIEKTGTFSRTTSIADVSYIQGEHYIRIHARDDNPSITNASELRIFNIDLDPEPIGGKVILLEGSYNNSNSIDMLNNISLQGQGDGTILYLENSDEVIEGIKVYEKKGCTISDLRIKSEEGHTGIELRSASEIKVKDVRFEGLNRGVYIPALVGTPWNVPDISATIKIEKCNFFNMPEYGIHVNGEDFVIRENTFLKGNIDIFIASGQEISVIENHFYNYSDRGIEIFAAYSKIQDCKFRSSEGVTGIEVADSDNEENLIKDNDLRNSADSTNNGIIDNGTNTIIKNNRLDDGTWSDSGA